MKLYRNEIKSKYNLHYNINKGKTVRNICTLIAVFLGIISIIINNIYIKNAKNSFSDTEMLIYDISKNKEIISYCSIILLIIAVIIFFLGVCISIMLCKCDKCGKTVITRYGSIYKYCPKCGKNLEI